MSDLVTLHGPAPLGTRSVFHALARAIVSQQLSTHAARAILERLESQYARDPSRYRRARTPTLRRLGLSRTKAGTLREVAKLADIGAFDDLDSLSDDDVRDRLTAIKGIGPWTAHMVMMFALGRPDVWPVGDLALARAAQRVKRLRKLPTDERLERISRRWRPWRAVAARVLWHHYLSERRSRA